MNEVTKESQLPAEQTLTQLAAEINAIKNHVRETVYIATCRRTWQLGTVAKG